MLKKLFVCLFVCFRNRNLWRHECNEKKREKIMKEAAKPWLVSIERTISVPESWKSRGLCHTCRAILPDFSNQFTIHHSECQIRPLDSNTNYTKNYDFKRPHLLPRNLKIYKSVSQIQTISTWLDLFIVVWIWFK